MLAEAFADHLAETKEQVSRLEQVFEMIGETARAKKCKGMEGLIEEGKEVMDEDGSEAVLDAGLIAAAQRVEHYEIAAYGCLIRYANILGHEEAAGLLQMSLDEEKAADEKLTEVSDAEILASAMTAGAESEA
jgi:ferritin-like metal-binding protein YciE